MRKEADINFHRLSHHFPSSAAYKTCSIAFPCYYPTTESPSRTGKRVKVRQSPSLIVDNRDKRVVLSMPLMKLSPHNMGISWALHTEFFGELADKHRKRNEVGNSIDQLGQCTKPKWVCARSNKRRTSRRQSLIFTSPLVVGHDIELTKHSHPSLHHITLCLNSYPPTDGRVRAVT